MRLVSICLSIFFTSSLLFSCKKDPKQDKEPIIEEVVDSTEIKEAVIPKLIEEEKVLEKKIVKKKNEKTHDGDKKYSRTTNKIPLPPGAPDIQDQIVRKYIRDYENYIVEYRKAVNSDDFDTFLKLSKTSSKLTDQYRSVVDRLSGDDVKMMSDYIKKKTKEIEEISRSQ